MKMIKIAPHFGLTSPAMNIKVSNSMCDHHTLRYILGFVLFWIIFLDPGWHAPDQLSTSLAWYPAPDVVQFCAQVPHSVLTVSSILTLHVGPEILSRIEIRTLDWQL